MVALGHPGLRFGQGRAPQKRPPIPTRRLKLAQSRAQPLLPGAKGAILIHPRLQPPPLLDEGFVRDLYPLLHVRVMLRHHQPVVRQAGYQLPGDAPQLLACRKAPRVLRPGAGLHQLHEEAPDLRLLLLFQPVKDAVGVPGQRPFHLADGLVRRMS